MKRIDLACSNPSVELSTRKSSTNLASTTRRYAVLFAPVLHGHSGRDRAAVAIK